MVLFPGRIKIDYLERKIRSSKNVRWRETSDKIGPKFQASNNILEMLINPSYIEADIFKADQHWVWIINK